MKRIYETPTVFVENFMAEEYVAACYFLACQVGPGKKNGSNGPYWNGNEYGGVDHAASGTKHTCADETANRVITDEGGLESAAKVGEYNGEQGWIDGGIDKWIDKNDNGIVDAYDIIYWHTFDANNSRRWNHYGVIQPTKKDHPNHS